MTNSIIHGNCVTELEKIESNSVDLIVADPPYGGVINIGWDKWDVSDYAKFSLLWLSQCERVLKDNGSIYVWTSVGSKSVQFYLGLLDCFTHVFKFKDMVVWSKQRGRGNIRGWLYTREEILWGVKDLKAYRWNREYQYSTHKYHEAWIKRLGKEKCPYKRATNVWTDIDEVTIEQSKKGGSKGFRKVLHPAQKPLAAIERLIKAHTQRGDLVLDPFGGSGTTAAAAKKLGRKYIIIEQEPQYVEIIKERLGV